SKPNDDTRCGLSIQPCNGHEAIGSSIVYPTERLNTRESLLQAWAGRSLRPHGAWQPLWPRRALRTNRTDDTLWPWRSLRPHGALQPLWSLGPGRARRALFSSATRTLLQQTRDKIGQHLRTRQ